MTTMDASEMIEHLKKRLDDVRSQATQLASAVDDALHAYQTGEYGGKEMVAVIEEALGEFWRT